MSVSNFPKTAPLVLVNVVDARANTVSDAMPSISTLSPSTSDHSSDAREQSSGDVVHSSGKAPATVLKETQDVHGSMSGNDNHLELSDSKSISDLKDSKRSSEVPKSSSDQSAMNEASKSVVSTTPNLEGDSSDAMNESNTPNDSSSLSEPLDDASDTSLDLSAKPSFKPLSFSFLKRTSNESNWVFGPPPFLEYMNTKYKSLQRKRVFQPRRRIVYEKKGTTGMAGQMIGVCDTLLLAILHDRAIQSRHLFSSFNA